VTTRAFVEQIMGMPISIHVRGPARPDQPTVQAAYDELRLIDALFSPFAADSDVSRIQRGELGLDEAHPLLREVAALTDIAEQVTEGAFTTALPHASGEVRWNPTGLVKGWAVERAGDILASMPATAYCINAGGDITCGTHRHIPATGADAAPWRIGVEDPRDRSRIAAIVPLPQGSLATSGTAARGAHLYDPRSGTMIDRAGSVTVFGPSLTWADVWATALFVGGSSARAAFTAWGDVNPGYQLIEL